MIFFLIYLSTWNISIFFNWLESHKDGESKESISICKSMRPLKIPAVFMMGKFHKHPG